MSRSRSMDEIISRWLTEQAPGELPDRVLRVTFERTRVTPQRRTPPPWRAHRARLGVPWLTAVAAVLIVVLAGGAGLLDWAADRLGGGPRPSPTASGGGWERLPDPPISARRSAHAFWVGSEFIAMGGTMAPPCPPGADCVPSDEPPLNDGAAYEPERGRWRRIADAPVPLGMGSGVVLGDTVYLWLHASATTKLDSTFLAYDATEDRWRTLPEPSSVPPNGYRLAATARGVVAYLTTEERGDTPDYLWDEGSGGWREFPPDPLSPSFDRTMVWAGDELVLLAIEVVQNPGSERPSVYRAASLDPAIGQWRRLPDSEIVLWDPTWYWAAGWLVNPSLGSSDGGEVNNWGRSYPHGGMLDPDSGTWSPLPAPRGAGATYQGISAGSPSFIVSSQGWVLDMSRSTWHPLVRPDSAPDDEVAAAWAGDRLIIFGGSRWQGDTGMLLDAAWEWLPPLADP